MAFGNSSFDEILLNDAEKLCPRLPTTSSVRVRCSTH